MDRALQLAADDRRSAYLRQDRNGQRCRVDCGLAKTLFAEFVVSDSGWISSRQYDQRRRRYWSNRGGDQSSHPSAGGGADSADRSGHPGAANLGFVPADCQDV